MNLQPKSSGESGWVILNRLRDLKSIIDISLIGNTCNLAGTEGNRAGNLRAPGRSFYRCRFAISFLGGGDRHTETSRVLIKYGNSMALAIRPMRKAGVKQKRTIPS